jgi:hypothetical protein
VFKALLKIISIIPEGGIGMWLEAKQMLLQTGGRAEWIYRVSYIGVVFGVLEGFPKCYYSRSRVGKGVMSLYI